MHRYPSVSIRAARGDDVAGMARLRDASAWTGGAPEETMRRYLQGAHHPRQARAPRVAFVAEAEGAIVGYVAGHLTERFGCAGELQWLLVHPAHRGVGVAERLVRALAEWFVAHQAAHVCVNVASDNERARRFYRRLGAAELSEHWLEWTDVASLAAG